MLIQFTHSGYNDLKSLSIKDQIFIRGELEALMLSKTLLHNPRIKKLKSLPYLRYRCGDFRVFLTQEGQILSVQKIRRRNEKTYK